MTPLRSPQGLVGDYLAYAGRPPVAPDAEPVTGWTADVAQELRRLGVPVRPGYPVGRWRVYLCVGTGADAVGVVCAVHPEGVAAHLERQRTLTRAGWRLHDVFASRWSDDPIRAALDLASRIKGR
ncbi:hypothetical protein [Micromonospora chersina]|uniref:hypothetical protein n=1 Tax=Micromonospora chersina TaxID=47854 RepID=UPI003715FD86